MREILIPLLAFPTLLFVGACDDTTGPRAEGSGRVEVRFATASGASSSLIGVSVTLGSAADSLVVEGSNGTLLITDIRMVVDEFELEGEGADCPLEDEGDDDDDQGERECKFESGSFFLDLPLDDGAVTVADDLLPAGTYDELEFEVEDVELDEDDDDPDEVNLLATEIRSEFPEWPGQASVMVEGSFLPAEGEAQPFRTFFDAEIEIEMTLNPPLVVDDEGADRVLTVEVRPQRWFRRIDGSVINLALLDFESTGLVAEFEVESEDGFAEVEFD